MNAARRYARDLKRAEGFTLTELLAVMAILGILAGLVAGAMTGLGEASQESRLVSDRVVIANAGVVVILDRCRAVRRAVDDMDRKAADG